MRDRLIEMLASKFPNMRIQDAYTVADHLLAEGVIVPPCKVGDKVYRLCFFVFSWDEKCSKCDHFEVGWYDDPCQCRKSKDGYKCAECVEIEEEIVTIKDIFGYLYDGDFGKTVFLTREEAEKALAEREGKG